MHHSHRLAASPKMATKSAYKTTFEPKRVIQPIYTGGSVALDLSGRILATTLGEDAILTDLTTGRELARIEGVCKLSTYVWHLLTQRIGWRSDLYINS